MTRGSTLERWKKIHADGAGDLAEMQKGRGQNVPCASWRPLLNSHRKKTQQKRRRAFRIRAAAETTGPHLYGLVEESRTSRERDAQMGRKVWPTKRAAGNARRGRRSAEFRRPERYAKRNTNMSLRPANHIPDGSIEAQKSGGLRPKRRQTLEEEGAALARKNSGSIPAAELPRFFFRLWRRWAQSKNHSKAPGKAFVPGPGASSCHQVRSNSAKTESR